MKVNVKHKLISIFKIFIPFYFIFCFLSCFSILILPWWPTYELFIIPKYVLLFGPRWWLLLAVSLLLVFYYFLSFHQKCWLPFFILISLNYLGLNFTSLVYPTDSTSNDFTIITVNVGDGGRKSKLAIILKYYKPDVILLQEAHQIKMDELFDATWQKECVASLCIASKHSFENVSHLSREIFNGLGSFVAFYKLKYNHSIINLANVHMETPRRFLQQYSQGKSFLALASSIDENRELEAILINSWAVKHSNTIVAGDFNMPVNENLYQMNFSHLNNALSIGGLGLNYTKYVKRKNRALYGVGIDHILFTDEFELSYSKVLESAGSDHLPVMAKLKIK